jgi:DNA topoisomerase IA
MNPEYLFTTNDHQQPSSAHLMHHHTDGLASPTEEHHQQANEGDERLLIWQQFLVSTIPPIVSNSIKVSLDVRGFNR